MGRHYAKNPLCRQVMVRFTQADYDRLVQLCETTAKDYQLFPPATLSCLIRRFVRDALGSFDQNEEPPFKVISECNGVIRVEAKDRKGQAGEQPSTVDNYKSDMIATGMGCEPETGLPWHLVEYDLMTGRYHPIKKKVPRKR